jgi:carbonic anhydrase/acetyltransferase-like protein (isoleucine patch superfamily)
LPSGDQQANAMSRMPSPLILPVRGRTPEPHAESWVAPNASVIGQVTLAARSSIWYGATLRELSDAEIANNRHNAEVYQRQME